MTDAEVVELLEMLAEESVVVEGGLDVRASRDPSDDIVLAAAVEGGARAGVRHQTTRSFSNG